MLKSIESTNYADVDYTHSYNNILTQIMKLTMNYTSRHRENIGTKLEFISHEELQWLLKAEPLSILHAQYSTLSYT